MIFYCLLSSLLNAVASLVLGVVVISKKPREPRTLTFAGVTLGVATWSAGYFLWQLAPDAGTALAYCRFFSAAAIVIPICYFHFATKLTGRERRREVLVGYAVTAPFVPLSFTGDIVRDVAPKMMFPHWPEPGALYPLYLAVFFYFLIRSWHLLYFEYRMSRFMRRNQLLYVLAYTVTGFAGGATNFLLWYDVPIPPIGNIFVGAYMAGVGYAVVRFRSAGFNLLVARVAGYGVLAAVLALVIPGLYALVLLLPVQGIGIVPLFFVSFLVVSSLFWLIPLLRRRLDVLLETRVMGARLPNREMLRHLAVTLSSAQGEAALFLTAAKGIGEALEVGDVGVYTRTEFETDFARRAGGVKLLSFPQKSPLAVRLQETGRSVLLDEVEHDGPAQTRAYFLELRRKQGIELAVPILGDRFFYGFFTLGARRGQALFNEVDVSLVEAIGLQVGLNLRARQLERQASQSEKLISLGTLAAGLAHELRNPLTSVQTFSALLREQRPDPEALQEFAGVVQRDVNRIASIVENVSAFAESNKVAMTAVAIGEVLRTVTDILRPDFERTKIELVVLDVPPITVRGNHGQLLQVFINLIQNAIQALENRPGSRVMVSVASRSADVRKPIVTICVADNGPGIDPALLPHIFEPFITTKATGQRRGGGGMGLGLAIVKRLVQHHEGEIEAVSDPGRGTTFRVHLPLLS